MWHENNKQSSAAAQANQQTAPAKHTTHTHMHTRTHIHTTRSAPAFPTPPQLPACYCTRNTLTPGRRVSRMCRSGPAPDPATIPCLNYCRFWAGVENKRTKVFEHDTRPRDSHLSIDEFNTMVRAFESARWSPLSLP